MSATTAATSTATNEKYVSELLSGPNYLTWEYEIKFVLEDENCRKTSTTESTAFAIVDSPKACRIILRSVDPTIRVALLGLGIQSAPEMWSHLYDSFSGKNVARKTEGIKSLALFKFGSGTVAENFNRLQRIITATHVAAGTKTVAFEDFGVAMLMNSLPNRFAATRAILEASGNEVSLQNARSALSAEEQRHGMRESTVEKAALAATPSRANTAPTSSGETCTTSNRSIDSCWHCHPELSPRNQLCKDCGQKGHKSANNPKCRKTIKRAAAVAFQGNDDTDTLPLKPAFKQRVLAVTKKLTALSIAKRKPTRKALAISTEKPKAKRPRVIEEIPSPIPKTPDFSYLDESYSSMDMVLDSGCSQSIINDNKNLTNYSSTYVVFKTADNGKAILRVYRQDDLYVYKFSSYRAPTALTTSKQAPSQMTELMHRRMGHLNHQTLKLLTHLSTGMTLGSLPELKCQTCMENKATKTPFPKSSSHAKEIGELTHADICSVGVPSAICKSTMFLLLIDDKSRFIHIYLLTHKSDAIDHIQDYDRKILNKTGKHMQILQSDGGTGGEFFSNDMAEYCRMNGIHQRSSTSYTPEQNGRAERANRTVLNGIRCLLSDSKLGLEYWGFAALTAVYLKNRSPHTALHKSTPYQEWFGIKPNLSQLRVFGNHCWYTIPEEVRKRQGKGHKIRRNGRRMIHIGYSDKYKAWRLYDPKTKEVIVSNNVTWESEIINLNGETSVDFFDILDFKESNEEPEEPQESDLQGELYNTDIVNIDTVNHTPSDNNSESATVSDTDSITSLSDISDTDSATEYSSNEALSLFRLLSAVAETTTDAPTFEEAITSKDKIKWQEAINKEYNSLKEHNVVSHPMNLPAGQLAIDTKLVLKLKEPEGPMLPAKFKARLCGKGFKQTHGVNYFNTFAPVATYSSLRLFITVLVTLDYEIHSLDVITAFLLADLKEDVYIKIPKGYPIQGTKPGQVLKLNKCLYGLKQSPMEWNAKLDGILKDLGFVPTFTDPCVYVNQDKIWYIMIYVDDLLIGTKTTSEMDEIKRMIKEQLPVTDKGPLTHYLNIWFKRNRLTKTVILSQPNKITKLLNDPQLSQKDLLVIRKPRKIPANSNTFLTKDMCPTIERSNDTNYPYRSILGQALYIAITTRPDIVPAVSACGKFAENPGAAHWEALLQILAYLHGTQHLGLELGEISKEITLTAYADADWAGDLDQRKSRSGYVVLCNNSSIIWSSKLQKSIALSSTEAEYVSLSLTSRDVIWCRTLRSKLGFEQPNATVIYEDNDSCIKIANSPRKHPGVKHIDIRYHFIKDRIASKEIVLHRMPTLDMVADLFTKQLPRQLFEKHRNALRLVDRERYL